MRRSPLIILFVTIVIDLLGFGIILPLLPLYVDKFGGTPVTAGVLSTAFSLAQFLFAPLWGRASDLYGRRPLILLSLLGSAVSFALFGAAQSLPMLFAARIAGGIMTAASLPSAHAYIADVTSPEKRSRGMALLGVAFGIGFACGPMIGGWLGHRYGLSMPAFFVAATALVNFVWSLFALPESRTAASVDSDRRPLRVLDLGRLGAAFGSPTLGTLFSVSAVSTFSFAMMEATFTWLILLKFVEPSLGPTVSHAVIEREAARTAGHIFMVVGITALVSQGAVMGGMAQRAGERYCVMAGALILASALYLIGATDSLRVLAYLAAGLAVGSSLLTPSLTSLISQAAPEHERGATLGLQQGLGSLARMVAPPLGTWLLWRFGTMAPYGSAAVLMAVAFVMSLRIGARRLAVSDVPSVI